MRQVVVVEFIPLRNRPYIEVLSEWIEEHKAWEKGEHEMLGRYGKEEYPHYANFGGDAPRVDDYRPDWSEGEATWWQVYETVSEGTPVTPPFETREELIEYLVENGDFWDQREGRGGWSREEAWSFVMEEGWAPTLVVRGGKVMTGVEALVENLEWE